MMKKLKIGKVELSNNILLAPMAGITDLPLRVLAKKGGAGLVYTEMVSAKAIVNHNEKTKKLLKISNIEKPVAVQIFGSDAYSMAEAAKIVRDSGADIVDINLGCPARKITKAGAGIKLSANSSLVTKILETVVKSADIPVTIKIRIGLLPGQNIASDIVKIAQNSGISMVAVHARPASQGHSGYPDLESFGDACSQAKIPIIANGGIIDEETAASFLKVQNCSGIMIGRGAIGNYSIFTRLWNFFNNNQRLPFPSKKDRTEWLRQHVECSMEHYGEMKGLLVMRKFFHYYVKDFHDAAKIRKMFNTILTISDFNGLMKLIQL
ncbi:MAG: tRNA dihydrouridine synthase DusB [Endomicrobium sp.]|nr:tRNA dihydrouridine synthase DusB [Endomicrobium sp.]